LIGFLLPSNRHYPSTLVHVIETFNHTPFVISIGTSIPKGMVFCFENYWMEHEKLLECSSAWMVSPYISAWKNQAPKYLVKNQRRILTFWQAHLSSLALNISNVQLIVSFLEILEEFRDLSY